MKLESSKSRLNNQKKKQIKGKITKIAATFIKNKANFKNTEIGVSPFKTNKYEILPAWRSKKQTQFKPNLSQNKADSNPICFNAIIDLSSFMTSKYVRLGTIPGKKTNPIQTQFKPNHRLSLIDNHLTKGTVEVISLDCIIDDYGKVIYLIKADSKWYHQLQDVNS